MTVNEWLNENELSIDIWKNKYRCGNETLDEWFKRVSSGNPVIERLIKDKKFIFGGRTLSNINTKKSGSYSNCYSHGYVPDSLEGIMEVANNIALTFKAQGGQGISLSKVRPKGALIKGQFESDGIIPFMEIFNTVTSSISQGGSRKGALMMSIDIWHPEASQFITIKSDLNKINKANLSLEIDDEFMDAIEKGITELHRTFDYESGSFEYTVNPVKLFDLICQQAWDYAEPGIIYTNRFRNYNLMEYVDDYQIETSNPCVIGETLILTNKGYVEIKNCVDIETNIWNGYSWSKVIPKVTGHNKQTYKVTFSNGSEIICTENHKFVLKDKSRKELKNLKVGDKLIKWEFPVINMDKELPDKLAYTMGFYSGDGYLKRENEPYLYLYGQKEKLIDKFVDGTIREDTACDQHRLCFIIQKYKNYFDKEYVISCEYSIKDRLSWLAGLVDSDGSRNSEDGSISITSVKKEFLKKVQLLLNTLGVHSTLALSKNAAKKLFSDHKGGKIECDCKNLYRLTISAYNVKLLRGLGFETYRVNTIVNPNRNASRFITIVSIEPCDIVENVYCLTEPKNHTFIANGCLTGNCGEQPLPKHSACNLSSINLSEYVNDPFTKNAYFNYAELKEDIPHIVKAMDDVLEKNLKNHALKQQKEMSEKWRNIGIGVMGLGDCLIKLGYKYGSSEAIGFCKNLMKHLFRESIFASIALAQERGSFPMYSNKIWDSNIIKNAFDKEEIEQLKELDCLRNCSLLSIAPTGSIGTMLNVSTGCEPFFMLSYTRKTESLNGKESYYEVEVPIVQEYKSITGDVKLPDYFVTSNNIGWKERVDMQSALQEFCDTAISSTVNLPESTTVEDVKNLYMYAWHKGLKGITIFRNNCKRLGILTEEKPKEESIQLETAHTLPRGFVVKAGDDCIGLKRTLTTGCGTLHCTAYFDPQTGKLLETYLSKGSKGGCQNFMVGLSRMISLAARGGLPLEAILDQLKSCGTCPSYAVRSATKKDTSLGSCCPIAVGNALKDMYNEMQERIKNCVPDHNECVQLIDEHSENLEECPECHHKTLIHTGGCIQCPDCGWSRCN